MCIRDRGGIDQAVALVKQRAKIPESKGVALIPYPARRTVLEVLLSGDMNALGASMWNAPELRMEAELEQKVQTLFGGVPTQSLLHGALGQGGILRLVPYRLTVR